MTENGRMIYTTEKAILRRPMATFMMESGSKASLMESEKKHSLMVSCLTVPLLMASAMDSAHLFYLTVVASLPSGRMESRSCVMVIFITTMGLCTKEQLRG